MTERNGSDMEYRVCWRREEAPPRKRTRLYQTKAGAEAWAALLVRLDKLTPEDHEESIPSLHGEPVIESRPVGIWSAET